MQVLYFFSRHNLRTVDITPFLQLTATKLSYIKNGSVFWPTLYVVLGIMQKFFEQHASYEIWV